MDGSSDIQPRVLPQPSNFAVRSGHPVIPNSLNLIGESGPFRCRTTSSHRWTSHRKDGRMIRRWRCNNMESSVNENRVGILEIFNNLMVRLIGVPDLLYLHRAYFVKAIRHPSRNPLGHKYSPSVLAAYRSARRLISSLRGVYAKHPQLTATIWFVN
jgi:hypothetical protein